MSHGFLLYALEITVDVRFAFRAGTDCGGGRCPSKRFAVGIQEALFGVGTLILLALLIYGVVVAGRRRHNARADAIARRNLEKTTPQVERRPNEIT
jgi:hypothetical protein